MRRNFIPALFISLVLAAPFLWAGQQQHGNTGAAPHGGSVGAVPHHASAPSSPHSASPRVAPSRGPAPLYVPRAAGPQDHPARKAAPGIRNMPPGRGFTGPPQTAPQNAPTVSQPPNSQPRHIVRGQGPHNGDWLRDTMRLPPSEQQKRLEQDQHFRQLPKQRQDELRSRLQSFNSMPPQQRQRVLNRMEMMERLRPEQQHQAIALFGQFQTMPPERKQMMRQTLRQMRGMPPEARERLLTSPEALSRYSPQEIQMLRGFNDIGFVGPE